MLQWGYLHRKIIQSQCQNDGTSSAKIWNGGISDIAEWRNILKRERRIIYWAAILGKILPILTRTIVEEDNNAKYDVSTARPTPLNT